MSKRSTGDSVGFQLSGDGVLNTLFTYFTRYGYWVVFFGVMLENAGIPVPGETVLLAAGFFAALGHFHLAAVMVVAALGAMLGDNAGYAIGRKLGRPTLEHYGRYVRLTPKRLARVDRFFERHGNKTVLFARFVTGVRVFAALFAGAARMRWWTFACYNLVGAVLWSVVITLVGFFFGKSWKMLEQWIGGLGLITLGVLVAVALVVWIIKRWKHDKQDESTDESNPQPE